MNKDLYIASKPMQIAVSTILAGNQVKQSILIVVDMFYGARDVYQKIKLSGKWAEVYFVKNRFQSFFKSVSLKPKNTFIDGDIGTRLALYITMFKFLSRTKELYVYEEGIGTYRNDIYPFGFKRSLLEFFGISTVFGGSWFCSGTYVFEPEKYREKVTIRSKKHKVIGIKDSMQDYCERDFEEMSQIYNFDYNKLPPGRNCFLYISDWQINQQILGSDNSNFDVKIIKLHPNIKCEFEKDGYNVVPNNVPAEVLICALAQKYKSVYVIHHGSSVAHYMNYENVKFEKF